jgi:hypothetical protein
VLSALVEDPEGRIVDVEFAALSSSRPCRILGLLEPVECCID